ncbi:amidase [Achromobacter sp. GG226]|uniref:amidase n=1 Tax=Verticiella alkaliphila TaxID=2779529 RepID=UPI001C0D9B05|nr:amidase [Verticiella sp. GG226]MBU4610776.1 amidase [Verticiella sp. GG226]
MSESVHELPWHAQPASALAQAVRERRVSALELTRYFLDRIARGAALAAFAEVTAERALAQAEAADRLLAAGIVLGPLHGVPVAIKDSLAWEGIRATLGSRTRLAEVSTRTSTAVHRLLAHGMPILGKTRMTEFAFGLSGQNPMQGTARNPWDSREERAPGGSSSGSGVAVAAGLAPLAVGGDTGGSVRAPAALNGLVGFKPSSGIISRAGCLPLSDSLDVLGPITRTVQDARLLTQVLAGPDSEDAITLQTSSATWAALPHAHPFAPKRAMFLPPEHWPVALSAQARAHWDGTLTALVGAGWTLTPWQVPSSLSFARMAQDNSCVLGYEGWRHWGHLADDAAQPMWDVVRTRLFGGRDTPRVAYEAALARRSADQAAFAQAMPAGEVLLLPACDQGAQPLDDADVRHAGLGLLLRPANFLDAPAVALPSGRDEDGMPLSLQVMAPTGQDARLLDAASALMSVLGIGLPDLSAWQL